MSLASHQMTIAWDETLVSYLPLQCVNDVSEANVCRGWAGEGVPDRPQDARWQAAPIAASE